MTRLCVYSGGFLTEGRLKRILDLAGYDVSVGVPKEGDWVGLWGRTRTAWRAEAVSEWTDAPVLTVEDAFLRSVHPSRIRKSPPIGLCLDKSGVHFDGSVTSDLETLLATHPLDDTPLLDRARHAVDTLKHWHLGKYSATDPEIAPPAPGYVVVIDQTEGDAALCGAGRGAFLEMLTFAATEHPGTKILIKTHPETAQGAREGHYRAEDETDRISLYNDPISPWVLFEGAVAVYTHSSNLGFEAIYAGHKPRVFGQPFYSGWGLTQDENAPARRTRKLTRAQLFAAAMILYPVWYDPVRDRLCDIENVLAHLAAEARAWREDRNGYLMRAMKPWKRPHLARAFGRERRVRFHGKARNRTAVIWGDAPAPKGTLRLEDGFLRSRGLGAALTPPLSLCFDGPGLYYDPKSESRLDRLIRASSKLPPGELERARRISASLRRYQLTKYNIEGAVPDLPEGKPKILVVGQVEDDASLVNGTSRIKTNRALLEFVRAENPDACLLWKPHPDVEAGLRRGAIERDEALGFADVILDAVGADQAIAAADAVWTLTSTLGFEALLRGKPVTCLGMPFYAGWGLTDDRADRPAHRGGNVTLDGLVHACLIAYPRYFDPRSGAPLSPESAVALLVEGVEIPPVNRVMALLRRMLP